MSTKEAAFLSFFQPGASLGDAALAYASIGLYVLPLAPRTKSQPTTKHGWHDATTNRQQIKSWWNYDPDRNIAIALRPSCIAVLDIDPRHNGDVNLQGLVDQHGPLSRTYTVKTANDGEHYYYRVPTDFYDIKYPGKLADGVELLVNKYVVAPPSFIDGKHRYAMMSGNIQDEFHMFPTAWIESVIQAKKIEREESIWTPQNDDWSVPHGEHDNTLTAIAGWARSKGASVEEIEEILQAFAHRFDEAGADLETDMIPRVARSIGKAPMGEIRFSDLKLVERKDVEKPRLDPAALYGPFGDYIEFLEPFTETHPAAILAQSLTVFGNLIGARQPGDIAPGFSVEDAYHRPSLFTILVGDSARAGKGDSWSRVKSLFRMVDPTWQIHSGVHTGEALIQIMSDEQFTDDIALINGVPSQGKIKGASDKRCFIYEKEFGRTLHTAKRLGSTTKDIYRELWDDGSTAKTTAGEQKTVTDATVSLVGHITKTELERDFEETDFYSGFGNRFLFIYTERTQILPMAESISKEKLREYAEPFKEALIFAQEEAPAEYGFSDEAWEYWCDFVFKSETRRATGIVDQLLSRARPFVLRLAVIYAVLSHSHQFEVEHLEAANAFWQYCADSASYLFTAYMTQDAKKLHRALIESGAGLTDTEIIHKVFSGNVKGNRHRHALEKLKSMGLLLMREEKRGRKTVVVNYVNPHQ